ncbi:MAG: hypothetical protein K0S11_1764 [Gammaproteobacteria bacterium]|jgi:hypothetical protein|nr:hypothetical protein [Gammaproteobacteria bacterium]
MLKCRDKSYISELDQFLMEFDSQHRKKSAAQLKEINKHQRVANLRDQAQDTASGNKLLEDF